MSDRLSVPLETRSQRRRRRRAERRRRVLQVVLGLVLALVLAFVGLGSAYVYWIGRSFDDNRRTVDVDVAARDAGGEPLNILLLGSDTRGEDPVDRPEGPRSDTMMLAHIPADRSGIYVMSILRDLYVEIPGWGEDKVNAAYGIGGHSLTVRTVEELLDVPVHHLVEIDFEGFRGVTEALGGVEVCNPTAFSSGVRNPSYYPRGRILLRDTAALRYVRERYAFGDGDVSRVENQQRVVAAAADRFLSVGMLANPPRTAHVVSVLSSYLGTDAGLDAGTLAGLGWELRGLDGSAIHMFTIPTDGPATTETGMSILEQDRSAMRELRRAFDRDDLAGYLAPEPEPSASASAGPSPSSSGDSSTASPSASPSSSEAASPSGSSSPSPVPLRSEVCGG